MKKLIITVQVVLASGLLSAAGGTVLWVGPARASGVEVSAVGSSTTYVLMHDLFPASLNDLLPGGTTSHQRIAATAQLCATGTAYGPSSAVPGGSTSGAAALRSEETAASDRQGCVDLSRSSTPPEPGGASTHLDYYAYALQGVAPMVGRNAGGSRSVPVVLTLTDMRNIYHCEPGYTDWKTVTGGSTSPIVRFWPGTGAGIGTLYANMLGYTPDGVTRTTTPADDCSTTPYTGSGTDGAGSEANRQASEAGIVYQASVDPAAPVADDVFIYSVGLFEQQWNSPSRFGMTKVNPVTGTAIGNFDASTLLLAQMQNRTTAAQTAPFANFTAQQGTFNATNNRGTFALNSSVVKEANEWYSHMPGASSALSASSAPVPGVSYVYNVADAALPTYSEVKLTVGFDNQTFGTKSTLCDGDDTSTIAASGFVPLNTGATAPPSSDRAGASCREFPATSYPGFGTTRSWEFNTWTPPTTPAGYSQESGFPAIDDTGTTLPVTTSAVGDIMLIMAHTAPSSGTSRVASISDSSGRISWQSAKSAGFTNHPSGDAIEIWYGVVQSVGATTIDVHWSGTTFDHFVWGAEWRSPFGAQSSWSVVSSGIKDSVDASGTTCAFPTLDSGSSGGLYWGWAYPATPAKPGTSPGFSYFVTSVPAHGNLLAWGPSLKPSTGYAPTFSQTTPTTWYDAVAVVVEATNSS